jgi:hypothetical protein
MDSDEKLESCFDGRKSTSMVGASVDFYNMRKDEKDHENATIDED